MHAQRREAGENEGKAKTKPSEANLCSQMAPRSGTSGRAARPIVNALQGKTIQACRYTALRLQAVNDAHTHVQPAAILDTCAITCKHRIQGIYDQETLPSRMRYICTAQSSFEVKLKQDKAVFSGQIVPGSREHWARD